MMRIYKLSALFLLLLPLSLAAQLDTLISENFQGNWEERFLEFVDELAYGSDSIWINLDADGATAANNRPGNWYLSVDFAEPDETPDSLVNVVLASSSWLENFNLQNLNWLVLPPLHLGDDEATLHWKSAPFQGPRYLDGYKVLLSTTEIDPFLGTYADTLFVAAEMIEPLPPGASDPAQNALNVAAFNFSPGYIHADDYTLEEYYILEDGANFFLGVLEPHSVSLAAYAGQTVYVAFLHDSFDDNLISLDDILVLGNVISSVNERELADIRLVTYPNPVENFLNVLFRLEEAASVQLELFDMNGRRMLALHSQGVQIGEQNLQLDLRRLPAGAYSLAVSVNGFKHTRQIIRR